MPGVPEHVIRILPYMRCVAEDLAIVVLGRIVELPVCDLCDGDRHKHSMHAAVTAKSRAQNVKTPAQRIEEKREIHMKLIWLLMCCRPSPIPHRRRRYRI